MLQPSLSIAVTGILEVHHVITNRVQKKKIEDATATLMRNGSVINIELYMSKIAEICKEDDAHISPNVLHNLIFIYQKNYRPAFRVIGLIKEINKNDFSNDICALQPGLYSHSEEKDSFIQFYVGNIIYCHPVPGA